MNQKGQEARSELPFYDYDGHPNTYGYVGGSPISIADPRGLDNPGMGPYGPSAGGSACECKSLGQRTWDRYRDTGDSIDTTIDAYLPWPINSATGLAGAMGGGYAAKDYGGRTLLQEAPRYLSQLNSTKFSLFRVGRPDIGRVLSTSVVTASAVYLAWNGGLLAGSGVYEAMSGGGCE